MEFIASQKYFVMSPKKLRLVAKLVRPLAPSKAVEVLPFVGKRAAEPLMKVIASAIANAMVKNVSSDELIIKEIQINEGPRLKRGHPVSRGRWHPYKKRMSHIRVILEKKKEPPAKADAKKESVGEVAREATNKVTKSVKKTVKKAEPKGGLDNGTKD